MTMIATDTAPDLAPNKTAPRAGDPRQAGWNDEIATPQSGEYNGNVPVDDIERDPGNRVPTKESIEYLAHLIKAEGLLQPITLRDLGGNRYRIIAGETRWLAFKSLGRATIPAMVRPPEDVAGGGPSAGDITKRLIENLGRTDLNPVDRARGFRDLCAPGTGRTQKEAGALFKLSQPVVGNMIRMLTLPEAVLDLIARGELSAAHGVALVKWAPFENLVVAMADLAIDQETPAKELVDAVMPFAADMINEGLIYAIRSSTAFDYRHRPVFKIPAHIEADKHYVARGKHDAISYYIIPENKDDDQWAPEQARQIEAQQKKEAEQAAQEAAERKSGKLTAEQIEARKKRDENKARREENSSALLLCIDKLKRTQEPTALLIGIMVEGQLAGGYGSQRIRDAAAAVGVTLPKGLADEGSASHGMREVELMAKMDPMELTRVALAVLLTKEVDDANKHASALPENVEKVMNSKVESYTPRVGDVVGWQGPAGMGDREGVVVTDDEFDGEWAWSDAATPVRTTKEPGSGFGDTGRIAVIDTKALYLVKAAPAAEVLIEVPATPKAKKAKKTKAKAKPVKKGAKS